MQDNMDLNNNNKTMPSHYKFQFNERDKPVHLHKIIYIEPDDKYLRKMERNLQRAADKMNMVETEDFTVSFEWLFK